jgi:GntR family transcriptional regulator, galactonate operon transcriptional repressor
VTEPFLTGRPAKRPARLGAVVVSELLDRIVAGQLPQLSTLPNEPMLCEAFGVSRTVIREAVKVLEEKGLLHARQGQGTTVAPYDDWNLLDPMVLEASVRHDHELRMLDDIVDVRRVLEAQMAQQAATNATDADLAEISGLLGKLAEQVSTPDAYILTDVDFHDAVMRASGNRLARAVVRTIHTEARASTRYNGQPQRSDCETSNAGHTAIYERITAGDADAAAAAMSEHILQSWMSRRPRRPRSPGSSGRPSPVAPAQEPG